MGFVTQVRLLLWKNWLVQKRRKCVNIFELILPLLLILLLISLRAQIKVTTNKIQVYDRVPIESPIEPVMFYPSTSETKKLMTIFYEKQNAGTAVPQGFNDLDVAAIYGKTKNLSLIIFSDMTTDISELPRQLNYTIRPPGKQKWRLTELFKTEFVDEVDLKQENHLISIQKCLGEAVIDYWLKNMKKSPIVPEINLTSKPFAHLDDEGRSMHRTIIAGGLPMMLIISFAIASTNHIKTIALEKEQLIKESMKIVGLKTSVYWASWFLTLCMFYIPVCAALTLLCTFPVSSQGAIMDYVDPFLLFLFLVCYVCSIIPFTFVITTLVSSATAAMVLGLVLFGLLAACNSLFSFVTIRTFTRWLIGLSFNVAVSMGFDAIATYELEGIGAQWKNLFDRAPSEIGASVGECMLMLLQDAILLFVLTWYLENVFPGQFGVSKPAHFCLSKSYWFGEKDVGDKDDLDVTHIPANEFFEKEPDDMRAGIQIKNLSKNFGPKVAVAGTSLNMYENQITVLLGHNGAGKTTTLSMLTGFIKPSKGTAIVNGFDIRRQMDQVHKGLGVCPQHNILFDTITVKNHLEFFGSLKGCSGKNLNDEVKYWAEETGLSGEMYTQSRFLSGGQKRKLSVAIALIGGSKILIFDEPTAGMDPRARRQFWDVIQKARHGRTVLLITHYMDEADLLGDRIAIMAHSTVVCCGTPMFLKKLYGTGYDLVVVKNRNCDVQALTAYIQEHIPEAKLKSIITNEVTYLLPNETSGLFPNLFRRLEENKSRLAISSFGITATTMEEVFLRVGELESHEATKTQLDIKDESMPSSPDEVVLITPDADMLTFNIGFSKLTGCALVMSQLKGLVWKKMIYSKRKWLSTIIFHALLPIGIVYYSLSEGSELDSNSKEENQNKTTLLKLDLDVYRPNKTYLPYTPGINPTEMAKNFTSDYIEQFGSSQLPMEARVTPNFYFDNYTWQHELEVGHTEIKFKMAVGLEVLQVTEDTVSATAYHNIQHRFAKPITVNMVMSTIVRHFLGVDYTLQSSIDHIDEEEPTMILALKNGTVVKHAKKDLNSGSVSSNEIGILVTIVMSTVVAGFIQFPVKERQVGAKHMQVVSGASTTIYWVSTFLWDFVLYILSCVAVLFLFEIFEQYTYLEKGHIFLSFLILVVYGSVALPFIYVVQFIFTEPITALSVITIFNIGSGAMSSFTMIVLDKIGVIYKTFDHVNFYFGLFFPNYNLAAGFVYMGENKRRIDECQQQRHICDLGTFHQCCAGHCEPLCWRYSDYYLAWDRPGIGFFLTAMIVQGVFCCLLLGLLESQSFKTIAYKIQDKIYAMFQDEDKGESTPEDSDVANERARIMSESAESASHPTIEPHDISNTATGNEDKEDSKQASPRVSIHSPGEYRGTKISPSPSTHSNTSNSASPSASPSPASPQSVEGTPVESKTSLQRKASRRYDCLLLKNLTKRYRAFLAVDRLCVGIHEQDCFGLLGQNGAGKTTTFKMLTGQELVTSGDAYLNAYSVKSQIKKVHEDMGYCPQFDPLIEQLTGRETLYMYARLRGIPQSSIPAVVEALLYTLLLFPDADKWCGTYSGGNKRKLSTGVALIGDPHFIMLDEPSAGMDPAARRQMWNVLSRLRASGRTLVLTSHSMEECEALCNKIGIMVNGKLKCLGSPQHLKSRFALGYTLIVKLGMMEDGSTAPTDPVVYFICGRFKEATVADIHMGYVHFQVPDSKLSLADVFEVMESTKTQFNVSDYSVQQTTLEQIFLYFTKFQVMKAEAKGFQKVLNFFC